MASLEQRLRDAIVQRFQQLPPERQKLVLRNTTSDLPDRQRRFAEEYTIDCNPTRAARALGYKGANRISHRYLNGPYYRPLQRDIERRLKEREAVSELKADYVRDYIHGALEFCPTDYFVLADDGDWCIDPTKFSELPERVKRLVESVESRYVHGRRYFTVKFVSKTAALSLAAKYTLTQNINAQVAVVPWDKIAQALENNACDDIEQQLEQLDRELPALINGQQH